MLCPQHQHLCMVHDVSDGPCYDCEQASECERCIDLRKEDHEYDDDAEFP